VSRKFLILLAVIVAILGSLALAGTFNSSPPPAKVTSPPPTLTPPASISTSCASDATTALDAWFASLPAYATVSLPKGACYLVSNSPTSLLTLTGRWGLTIDGNGSTFEQTAYVATGDPQAPVLTIGGSLGVTISGVTLRGPGGGGGAAQEGDIGLLLWQDAYVNLTGDTITSTKGDGLDVYPHGNQPGVNQYVTFNGGTIENVGYHAIVPEAADHFTVSDSTISSGDIDAEVDFNCQPPKLPLADCGTLADPAIGLVNFTLSGDSFPNGLALHDGMSCMPIGNWSILNNNLGSGGLDLQFDTTYSLSLAALVACGQYSGLTIAGNTATANSEHPCCGGGSAYIVLQGWKNVAITGNHLSFTPSKSAVADLWGDSNVTISGNVFAGLSTVATTGDAPSGWPATTGVIVCGNTTGPTTAPVKGAACGK
jgi:hypothetical protein